MSTGKVDSKKRIRLPDGRPGDIYDIQRQPDGSVVLVRLQKPAPVASMTREQCLKAMDEAPLSPALTWEQLRDMTREP